MSLLPGISLPSCSLQHLLFLAEAKAELLECPLLLPGEENCFLWSSP